MGGDALEDPLGSRPMAPQVPETIRPSRGSPSLGGFPGRIPAPMTSGRSDQLLDTAPLAGLRYACLPGCGLCCYAEPLVVPAEKGNLLRIAPGTGFRSRGTFEFVRSNPEGGACQLLAEHRCRAHAVRPGPCREYPLAGYAGPRLQVIAALSCPGVELAFLDGYRGPETAPAPQGFDTELAALRARISGDGDRRLAQSRRRGRRIARALAANGRWVGEDEVRRQLRERLPLPRNDDLPTGAPPSREEGLELLPLVFDGRRGPLAFAARHGGWELLELRPEGGIANSLGVTSPPDRLPALSEEAGRILAGYLRYWLERDQLFGIVHLDMAEDRQGDVTHVVAAELRRIAAVALSRAQVLASLCRGKVGSLSGADLLQGIRATDQDLLDRPAWGMRL